MRLLFAISVSCFCAMFWVAISVARRLKRGRVVRFAYEPAAFPTEFFEAGEYRTPRPLRVQQDVATWRLQAGMDNTRPAIADRSGQVQPAHSLLLGFAVNGQVESKAVRPAKMRRIDLSRFRENPGDSTDPYGEISHVTVPRYST